MNELISRFTSLPPYGLAAIAVLLLYAVQAEVRFGQRARTMRAGPADRRSSLVISVAAAVPVIGFVLAMKADTPSFAAVLPVRFRHAELPGLPWIAWAGVALGLLGVGLRLWAVLKLRERYTRTLLVHDEHSVERGGPYRWVRHPGYLGSLLTLNGIALASGNWVTLVVSLAATIAAYRYRIGVEDEMLVAAFGETYAAYRREVGALVPLPRRAS